MKQAEQYARTCDVTGEGMNEGWYHEHGTTKQYFKYEKDALEYITDYMSKDPDAQFILCACMDDDKLSFAFDELDMYWTTFE